MAVRSTINSIAHLAQKEGRAEADALFLSIGEGAIVTDAQGRISRVNQTALNILGFKEKELIGKWFPETIISENKNGRILSNLERPITQVFLSGKTISGRVFYHRKNGSKIAVSLTVAPVLLRDKPIGAIEVFRDITSELALENAKDDFISIASHQLRTPATGVKQYIGMLIEGYAGKLTRNQTDLLKRAYQSNERQLKIIEDLLKVARVDAGNVILHVENFDLIKLLKDIIHEQSSKLRTRKQELSLNSYRATVLVDLDTARMRMVFENILDNAIKYTPEGMQIKVEVSQKSQNVIIKVLDQGVGIPAKDLKTLFQKFSRIPNPLSVEAGGTGLGLYWAEKIVKLHSGKITVSSSLGSGTCFTIHIPIKNNKFNTEDS